MTEQNQHQNERLESILKKFLTEEGRLKAREYLKKSSSERRVENTKLNHSCVYQEILEGLEKFAFEQLGTQPQRMALCRFMAESYEKPGMFFDAARFHLGPGDDQRINAYEEFFRNL